MYSTRAQIQLGVCFVPFPDPSSSGDQVLGEYTVPGGPCMLINSLVPASLFPPPHLHPREHRLRCAVCLLWGADLRLWPSWRMSTVQDPRKTWLATEGLLTFGGGCHLWGRDCPLPSNSGCGSPASLPPVVGEGPVCRRLAFLWCSLNPLFCERARLHIRLEPFAGKFSLSLFFFSLAILQFGLLSHVSSLRLSSGHSGQVLILSMQPLPPCQAATCWWQRWASGLLLCWQLWLGAYSVVFCFFFFPPSYVALWDSKTLHRSDDERVSCCVETSPSQFPPQDGSLLSLTLLPRCLL